MLAQCVTLLDTRLSLSPCARSVPMHSRTTRTHTGACAMPPLPQSGSISGPLVLHHMLRYTSWREGARRKVDGGRNTEGDEVGGISASHHGKERGLICEEGACIWHTLLFCHTATSQAFSDEVVSE